MKVHLVGILLVAEWFYFSTPGSARPIKTAISKAPPSLFHRILIEDSSFCPMAGGNADTFPAHGNGKVCTAGFKVDLTYDLITAQIDSFHLHRATEQDKTLGNDGRNGRKRQLTPSISFARWVGFVMAGTY